MCPSAARLPTFSRRRYRSKRLWLVLLYIFAQTHRRSLRRVFVRGKSTGTHKTSHLTATIPALGLHSERRAMPQALVHCIGYESMTHQDALLCLSLAKVSVEHRAVTRTRVRFIKHETFKSRGALWKRSGFGYWGVGGVKVHPPQSSVDEAVTETVVSSQNSRRKARTAPRRVSALSASFAAALAHPGLYILSCISELHL